MKSAQNNLSSQHLDEVDQEIHRQMSALTPHEAHSPLVPPEVCLREAEQLLDSLEGDGMLWGPLKDLGIDEVWMEKTKRVMMISRQMQTSWKGACEHESYEPWSKLEVRGMKLRAHMIAMARYHMRHNEQMLREVWAIEQGDGVSDLILDLDALARLFRAKKRMFTKDQSVDLPALITAAKSLARELRDMMFDVPEEIMAAREGRDRAFCILERMLEEARAAGRYRFWDDEEMRASFLSAYRTSRSLR